MGNQKREIFGDYKISRRLSVIFKLSAWLPELFFLYGKCLKEKRNKLINHDYMAKFNNINDYQKILCYFSNEIRFNNVFLFSIIWSYNLKELMTRIKENTCSINISCRKKMDKYFSVF